MSDLDPAIPTAAPAVTKRRRTARAVKPTTVPLPPVVPASPQPFDYGARRDDGQYERYPVAVGAAYVQPLRNHYRHTICGGVTRCSNDIAETYATNPAYYSLTFCSTCREHFSLREFVWLPDEVPMHRTSGPAGRDLRTFGSRYVS